jgi:3-oxoadipate enol-lactonase
MVPDHEPTLPPGDWVDLPGRGRAWVWDTGGDRAALTVVLLHGWTSTAALNWSRCFGPLATDGRVLAMDHRGHGRGIRSARTFSLEDCADDVAALVELLGVGPVVAAGYSMGGPVAQLLWRRHPDKVQGLVLCATAARLSATRLHPVAAQAIGVGLGLALGAVPVSVREEGLRRLGFGRDTSPGLAPWAVAENSYGSPVAYLQAAGALAAYDSTSWIGTIDRPTAVIVTTKDEVVSPLRQWAMARAIPGAVTTAVPADHHACVEDAPLFVPALQAAVRHAAA